MAECPKSSTSADLFVLALRQAAAKTSEAATALSRILTTTLRTETSHIRALATRALTKATKMPSVIGKESPAK